MKQLGILFLCSITLMTGCRTAGPAVSQSATPPCCRELKSTTPPTDKSLYQLDSEWRSDAGRKVRLEVLRGRPQVVAMFFTKCEFACPIIVNDMRRLEAALPEAIRQQTDFLLISFDSERDNAEALRAYRTRQKLPMERWTLLAGEPDDVREMAALLGVNYRQDARGQFAHSNLITLLNAEGEVVAQQNGLNVAPEEMMQKVTGLFAR